MLMSIRADDFDIDVTNLSLKSNLLPLTSGRFDGIAGVCNHTQPQSQIISRDTVCQSIALALYVDRTQIP